MLTILLATSAMAQGLVPTYDLTTEHDYKIEVIYQNPDMQESANHQKADAELWGGHIRCKGVATRIESCTFVDGVFYWGWLPYGTTEAKVQSFDAPATIEFIYGPTGRIKSWDMKGDRAALQLHLTEAYASRVNQGAWRLDSPDFRRVVGQELEQRLVLVLASALDVELPKKGDASAPWKYTSLPYFARRSQGGLGAAKLTVTKADSKPESTLLTIRGDATITLLPVQNEVLPYASGAEQTFYEDLQGAALINTTDGRILATEIWSFYRSTLPIVGFRTAVYRATAWGEGMTAAPGPVPAPPAH